MGRAAKAGGGLFGLSLLLAWGAVAWAGDPPLGGARVGAVEGEAQVRLAEDGIWKAAPLHMPLLPGDRLQIGPAGWLEILLSNGTAIRLAPASSARLVAVPPSEPAEDAAAELELDAGRAIVATSDGAPARPAVVLNATGTRIHIYPRTQLRAEAVAPDATEVVLREGAATAETLGTTIPLRAGEALQAGRGGAVLLAGRPLDAFDHWSAARDRALAAAPPASPHLPPPLSPHASDLDRYGQWAPVPEYGYVWRPTAVAAGWAPFTAGRWVWRAGTWVWLPAEPWGWLPFHYGRWRWDPILGWYWVPPRTRAALVWSPGAVAWIRTPGLVTWIPLAPGEIYYAPRSYGLWSAPAPATTVINITHVHIHKTFVNAAAPAALGAAPAATFAATTVVSPMAKRMDVAALAAGQPAAVVTAAALAPTGARAPAAAVRPAWSRARPQVAPAAQAPGIHAGGAPAVRTPAPAPSAMPAPAGTSGTPPAGPANARISRNVQFPGPPGAMPSPGVPAASAQPQAPAARPGRTAPTPLAGGRAEPGPAGPAQAAQNAPGRAFAGATPAPPSIREARPLQEQPPRSLPRPPSPGNLPGNAAAATSGRAPVSRPEGPQPPQGLEGSRRRAERGEADGDIREARPPHRGDGPGEPPAAAPHAQRGPIQTQRAGGIDSPVPPARGHGAGHPRQTR